MEYKKIKTQIENAVRKSPSDPVPYEDMFSLCRDMEKEDFAKAHKWNQAFRKKISAAIRLSVTDGDMLAAEQFDNLLFRSLLFGAPHFFDDYLQAVEFGKPLDKKFYQPRRHYLKRYVDAYQEVLEGKLDFLSISMPKRAGKSQLGINFTNMLSGKFPDRSTLMEGTGDDLVKSFYLGCLEYMTTPSDYHFYDIFPESKLVQTNADTKIINLLHKSRFPTVMCRSIDARQVGLSEATNLLYLDDCVEGREEAKNRQRLDDKWEVISGDVIGRAIEGTPIVICGTRYSLYDPIGRLQEEMRKQGKRMFKKSERVFLRLILNICHTLVDMDLKVCNIEIRFTRRNYENIYQKAQVLDLMLKNEKIHPRLAFEHCGLFVDSDLAYTLSVEYAEEQEKKAQELFEKQQAMKEGGNEDDPSDNEGNGGTDGNTAQTREQGGNTD